MGFAFTAQWFRSGGSVAHTFMWRYVLGAKMRLFALIAIIFSNSVFALDDYKCVITNAVAVESNGDLKVIGDKSIIDKMFTVNRRTGDMTLVRFNN